MDVLHKLKAVVDIQQQQQQLITPLFIISIFYD